MKLTGKHINYYFHCRRHLWFFMKSIQMEHNSDTVALGRVIAESSYSRTEHEMRISDEKDDISIDFFDKKNNSIHEIKKSDKMENLHIWQAKYYINVLTERGITGVTAEIDYPKLRQKIKVGLSPEDIETLGKARKDIEDIAQFETPPPVINKPFCKNCSYYELCYI